MCMARENRYHRDLLWHTYVTLMVFKVLHSVTFTLGCCSSRRLTPHQVFRNIQGTFKELEKSLLTLKLFSLSFIFHAERPASLPSDTWVGTHVYSMAANPWRDQHSPPGCVISAKLRPAPRSLFPSLFKMCAATTAAPYLLTSTQESWAVGHLLPTSAMSCVTRMRPFQHNNHELLHNLANAWCSKMYTRRILRLHIRWLLV